MNFDTNSNDIDYAQYIKKSNKQYSKQNSKICLLFLWIAFILSIIVLLSAFAQIYAFQIKAFYLIKDQIRDPKQAYNFFVAEYDIIKWIFWIGFPISVGCSITSLVLTKKTIEPSQKKSFVLKMILPVCFSIVLILLGIMLLHYNAQQIIQHDPNEEQFLYKVLVAVFCLLIIFGSIFTIVPFAKAIFKSPDVTKVRTAAYMIAFAVAACYFAMDVVNIAYWTSPKGSLSELVLFYFSVFFTYIGVLWCPSIIFLMVIESLTKKYNVFKTVYVVVCFAIMLGGLVLSYYLNWKAMYTTSNQLLVFSIVRAVIDAINCGILMYMAKKLNIQDI